MLEIVRELLLRIVSNIDSGSSDISDREAMELVKVLKEFTDRDKPLSKYQACQYLNVSRATFDSYVREGKLPKGRKEAGWKELSWTRKELDMYRNYNKQ